MGFSASDVVPFTQARSHLSELADQAKAGAAQLCLHALHAQRVGPGARASGGPV